MKSYKIFFLVLITVSTVFTSCKNNDEIGLESPINLLEVTLLEDTEITSYSFLENTHQYTNNTTYALVGSYADDITGTLSAYHYSELNMASEFPDFGVGFVCDSAILNLSHAIFDDGENHTYGDTLSTMPISVWQISDVFDDNVTYKSTDVLTAVFSIGETALDYQPKPGTDGIVSISLNQADGQTILNSSQSQSNTDFQAAYGGIKIGASDGSFGAVLGFENLSTNTNVTVYYHNDSESSLSHTYYLTGRRFNQYVPDYSGSEFSSLSAVGDTVNSTLASNRMVMQSGTGLGSLLKFPEIENLIDSTTSLSIVKAELVMSIEDNTTLGFVDEPNLMLVAYEFDKATGLIKIDSNGDPEKISNDKLLTGEFNSSLFYYDESTRTYTLPLTGHFEDYQTGGKDNLNMCIQGYLKETRINRSIISNASGTNPLKLNFYYTVLK